MAEKRVSRKELLKAPDEFLTVSEKVYEYIATHSKQFTFGLLALAAVVILFVGITWYRSHQAHNAMTAYNAAADLAENNTPFDPEKGRDALKSLERFRQTYPSSHQSVLALIQLGDIHYKLGEYDQAEAAYQDYIKNMGEEDRLFKPFALSSLAHVFEAMGKADHAVAVWRQVLDLKNEALSQEAYIALGRIYQLQEKYDEAKKAYQNLIDQYPSSNLIDLARSELAQLNK